MRDRVTDLTALLYPAEGLDPASKLFSSPPIESLEWLKELGEIARVSFVADTTPLAPLEEIPVTQSVTLPSAEPVSAPQTADAKLLEALHEYHRLRGPTLGARTLAVGSNLFARNESSSVATRASGFNSIEIPVIHDYVPKTSASPHRSSQPVHTVLKSKPRP